MAQYVCSLVRMRVRVICNKVYDKPTQMNLRSYPINPAYIIYHSQTLFQLLTLITWRVGGLFEHPVSFFMISWCYVITKSIKSINHMFPQLYIDINCKILPVQSTPANQLLAPGDSAIRILFPAPIGHQDTSPKSGPVLPSGLGKLHWEGRVQHIVWQQRLAWWNLEGGGRGTGSLLS